MLAGGDGKERETEVLAHDIYLETVAVADIIRACKIQPRNFVPKVNISTIQNRTFTHASRPHRRRRRFQS